LVVQTCRDAAAGVQGGIDREWQYDASSSDDFVQCNKSHLQTACSTTVDNGKKRLCIALDVRSIFPRMATVIYPRPRTFALQPRSLRQTRTPQTRPQRIYRFHRSQPFSSSARLYRQRKDYKNSFGTRLRKALAETKIKWYPIPVALGIAFLGLSQLYRVNEREKAKRQDEELEDQVESTGRPKRRERIRPTGPWLVF
jgi:hypothetical protein